MTLRRSVAASQLALWAGLATGYVSAETPMKPETAQASEAAKPGLEFGAFLDAGYLKSLNSPSNHLFRSRGTTPRVQELDLNMAGGYFR